MTSLDKLSVAPVVKALCVGYPGSGKTGSLASLVNTGRYKLRVLDFDGNFDPLLTYVDPKYHENVDIVTLKDRLHPGQKRMETRGKPTALMAAQDYLNHWKYKDGEEEIDLGKPSEWGPDHILVLDSLTNMGRAVMNWVLFIQDRVVKGPRKSDWGVAQGFQEGLVEKLMSRDQVSCHTILTAHLKMIGPPEFEESDDTEEKKDKEKIRQHVSYKLFPSALGRALPPEIAKHCPYVLRYETIIIGQRTKRVIRTVPNLDFDGVAVPLKDIPDELRIEEGLKVIFEAVEKGVSRNEG